MIECREIAHDTILYLAAVGLRDRMLRRPLGLTLSIEELARESAHRHFVLVDGASVVACLMVVPVAAGVVQIRQMAVDDARQGTGLGRLLMSETERLLASEGIGEVFLHARETAIGFYTRLGYAPSGERFTEVGLVHQRMGKAL